MNEPKHHAVQPFRPLSGRRGIQLRLPFQTWPSAQASRSDRPDNRQCDCSLDSSPIKETHHAMFPV